MQGKVKIQLTDVNTGKKIEREEHNIVTNAVADLIQCWVTGNLALNSFVTPIATKALGGLMLFDNSITEAVTETEFPRYAHLKGFALQSTSDDKLCGSLSSEESGVITNGYRCVWNFNTSQCNGTIASLARTYNHTPMLGVYVIETNHTPQNSGSNYGCTICYDETSECFYLYNAISNTSLGIYRQRQCMNKYKVTDYAANRTGSIELVNTLTIENLGYRRFEKNVDGYLYNGYCSGNTTGNGTFSYQRIKYDDLSFAVSSKVDVTCTGLLFKTQYVTISGNKALLIGNDQRYAYLVNLTNTSSIITVDAGENSYFELAAESGTCGDGNGHFRVEICAYTGGTNYERDVYDAIIYEDGTIVSGSKWVTMRGDAFAYPGYFKYFSFWNVYKRLDAGERGYGGYHYTNKTSSSDRSHRINIKSDYLGTICNLATPIVKTNTQTMKITYDLIDV